MANAQLNKVLEHLRNLSETQLLAEASDAQLLDLFVSQQEEPAFAALLQRHGPMVLSVSQRVLHRVQDAEDVFQATFLLLARKAGSIRKRESVSSWLHGVAHRLAIRAKMQAVRRHAHEKQAADMRTTQSNSEVTWPEVQAVLDAALGELPEKYRTTLVLCYLEGKSHAEAAQLLGCPLTTVRTRVARGRTLLRNRLTSRGLTLSAAGLTAMLMASAAPVAAPAALVKATLKAALPFAAGQAAAAICSAPVAGLVDGGLRAMFLSKVKTALAVLLAVSVLAGAGALTHRRLTADQGATSQAATNPQPGKKDPSAQNAKDENIEVSGRVLNPEGKPVAAAKLYVPRWLKERPGSQDDIAVLERGTTGRDGRFQLSLPRNDAQPGRPVPLVAAADGYGLAWVDLPQDSAPGDLTLRLVKDVSVRGRIITPEGKPVTGITVAVVGVLAFERLDDFLRVYQREIRHADEGTGTKRLALPLNKVLRITPSDKDGWFAIRGLGAERLAGVELKNAGLAQDTISVVTREGLDTKAINRAVAARATPGAADRGRVPVLLGPSFEHVAVPARPIEGTVREAGSGKPVAGASITMLDSAAVSDNQGHYVLHGLRKAREYTLQVAAPKNAPLIGRWVKVTDVPGLEPIKADIELPRGVIVTGRVIDKATGKGVGSAVRFSLLPENQYASKEPNLTLATSTDADGSFRLVTVPGPGVLLAGVWGTVFKIEGVPIYPYKPAKFDPSDRLRLKRSGVDVAGLGMEFSNACKVLDLKEGSEPVSCDLVLDPGMTATVKLEDPDGKPLAGALAAGVSAMTIRAVPLKSATCPVYALDPEKPRQMVFFHAQRKLAAVATVRGDEKEPLTIRLAPTAVLTGRALDLDGQPVARAEVHLMYLTEAGRQLSKMTFSRILPLHTDKEGRFRLEGIVPGLKADLIFRTGRQMLVPEEKLDVKQGEPGKTFDLGDLRTKPRSQ